MTSYSYPESKLIDEVTFQKTERGAVRAYLHAGREANPAQLQEIITGLRALGWQCTPTTEDRKPMLEVRGFKWPTDLVKVLEDKKWATGQSQYTSYDDRQKFTDKLRKRSLQASGAAYAWGDISFFLYGLKNSSHFDAAAGIFYGLPTPVLMAFGNNDQSAFQIKDIARKMADYVKKEGDNLPPQCSLESISADHKKGLLQTTHDLFQRYPSEFMNLCYAAAGTCIGIAAVKNLRKGPTEKAIQGWLKHLRESNPHATYETAKTLAHKNLQRENWLNLGVGGFTVGSGLFGTLVKEKAPDPDAPKKHGLGAVWEWVQERPLAITGVGLMVSTFLHAISTGVAMKGHDSEHKQAVPMRASFVISALIAEILVAISSKGHGSGVKSDDSVENSAISIGAELIAKQPDYRQDYLIKHMAMFLGRQDVLAMGTAEVTRRLRAEVRAMHRNPWAASVPPAAEPASQNTLAAGEAGKKNDLPAWQSKVAIQETTTPSPQLSA